VPIPPGGTEIDSGVAASVRGVVGGAGAASGPPHAAAVAAQAASAAHRTRATGERRTAPGMIADILARFGAPPSGRAANSGAGPPVDELWMATSEVRPGRQLPGSRFVHSARRYNCRLRMADFSHLHLHTQYSLLDGAIRLDQLFPKVLERGMKSVAITDHGNLFGALDFYQRAKAHGVKPIFGCETYIAPDRHDKTERKSNHMILLARDAVGWKNLSYLNSMGYLEGFYYNPRIDKKLLREHSEGLIGLSACLGGEVAQTIMRRGPEAAEGVAREFEDIFGKGNFFLEVQPNGLEEQETVNGHLQELARKTGIPLVATNDCHYLNQTDARAHEILMCVQQKKTIHDDKRLHHRNEAFFVKTPGEMDAYFKHLPEAMENAARIGELCNVEFKLGETFLPRFQVPDGMTAESYLLAVAEEGLARRIAEANRRSQRLDEDAYRARLKLELAVITKMSFAGYFLIVWDFIRYAKDRNIPVGPGRGSGAGSLVAYSLRITDIDPISNKLLFERFLNPERVSMPDFDIDFCMNRRDEVIQYVTQKYGKDNVGQIVTMHQIKARSGVRDIARAMAIPFAEADKVAKFVPEPVQGKSPPIAEAIEKEPRLKALYDENPTYRELLDVAKRLEGLNRHAGKHAAGVVIGDRPLWEYVPCFRPAGDEDGIVTQYDKDMVEKAGLVKFDFLGLKTLTVIQTCLDIVNKEKAAAGQELLDLSLIPLDDVGVYKMISAADVTGVFQLESSGFRELLKKLKPDCFEDIVAAGALYRPGPLEGGMVDDFIERKHGRKRVEYDHPILEPILKDTYGVIVYQEQVMQISSALAGYSLGKADLLRRAMGKKKAEAMAKEKVAFLDGAKEKKVDSRIAERVFDLMEKFAGYGFNRSHSAAYGLLTYQTAYLKRYFPVEFYAALLTCDKDDTDAVVKFISEAKSAGLSVLRPDVNESDKDFTTVEPSEGSTPPTSGSGEQSSPPPQRLNRHRKVIRFGLGAVKGVGEGAVDVVKQARDDGGPFLSIFDFCKRVDGRKVNRKVLEALVKAGAFDGVAQQNGVSRARFFCAIDMATERAAEAQRERESGQTSLLSLFGGGAPAKKNGASNGNGANASNGANGHGLFDDKYPDGDEWMPKELLAYEKESLGFYISGHPLDRFAGEIKRFTNATARNCFEKGERAEVILAGVVTSYQERPMKNGSGKYAFMTLEDHTGQVEYIVNSKKVDDHRDLLSGDEPLLVTGTVDAPFGDGENVRERLRFLDAKLLSRIRSEKSSLLDIRLNADVIKSEQLQSLEKLLRAHAGPCRTTLRMEIPKRSETVLDLGDDYKVAASDDLLARIEQIFGERVAVLR
jgi:DNA polymerase-3 subunit alpha